MVQNKKQKKQKKHGDFDGTCKQGFIKESLQALMIFLVTDGLPLTRFVQVGAGVLGAGSPDPNCANRTAVYTGLLPVIHSDDFFKEVRAQSNVSLRAHLHQATATRLRHRCDPRYRISYKAIPQ